MTILDRHDVSGLSRLLLDIVTQAGHQALTARRNGLTVAYDQNGSPSTDVDFEVSRFIQSQLAMSGYPFGFSGEEVQSASIGESGLCAVIDGIDGTRNFRDGNYGWCISVAILEHGQPVIGVVHDPYLGETFHAIKDGGARSRTGTGTEQDLRIPSKLYDDFSFSIGSFRTGGSSAKKERIVLGIKKLGGRGREWGCVALSICGVARGGLGIFVQANSFLHDHVAALLIAQESGAQIIEKATDVVGRTDIAVCHPSLSDPLRSILDGNW